MTVYWPGRTIVSWDETLRHLRRLVEAAQLTLDNGDTDSARKNLRRLDRILEALPRGEPLQHEVLEVTYGTVSLRDVRQW